MKCEPLGATEVKLRIRRYPIFNVKPVFIFIIDTDRDCFATEVFSLGLTSHMKQMQVFALKVSSATVDHNCYPTIFMYVG